jgi:anti-sigma regulatory factor (Ser/Thr protein kinase)
MNGSQARIFQARSAQLALAIAFVEEVCEHEGVAPGDALRLTLIVEELFTNTLMHGHRGDHDSSVHIELQVGPSQLVLYFADQAPPFDPLQYLATLPRLDKPVEELKPGGLGLALVARMSERLDYVHAEGFNRLSLVLRREA